MRPAPPRAGSRSRWIGRRSASRFIDLFAVAAIAAAATLASGAAAHAEEPAAKVALSASDAAGRPLAGAGYFVLDAVPGATLTGHVLASNLGTASGIVSLVPVDAATGPFGGVSYGLPDAPRTAVATWIEVESPSFDVAPGRAAVVPFRLTVPRDAAPGEHLAGLAAFVPVGTAGPGRPAVQVQQRAVVAVQVNLPGARTARLAVRGLTLEYRPDAAYVIAHVPNEGNTLLAATGALRLTTSDGRVAIAGPLSLETTVPGTAAAYPIRWAERPAPGRYPAHVELAWDGGSAVWDGELVVGDRVQAPSSEGFFVANPGAGFGLGLRELVAAITLLLAGAVVVVTARRRTRTARRSATPGR